MFDTDSPHSQDRVLDSIHRLAHIRNDAEEYFNRTQPTVVRLSDYRTMYDGSKVRSALSSLSQYRHVKLDRNHSVSSDSDSLIWGTDLSYVDQLVLVPRDIGFDVLIPRQDPGPNYTFFLDFAHRGRQFKTKHAQLGFDPTHAMMHIGYCGDEQIWLGLRSNTLDDDQDERVRNAAARAKDTLMPVDLQHMLIMCIANMLARVPIHNIYVRGGQSYPHRIDRFKTLKDVSNLMSVHFFSFR